MTTREVLKQMELTDEQINALDAKAIAGFDKVLAEAVAEREAAELAKRAQEDLYANRIAPELDKWGIESTQKDALIAFYKTQAEGAKTAGFIPKDAPGFTPPAQDPATGKFVAGGNPVPGSPQFSQDQILEGISNATWFNQQHQLLYGQPAPDDFLTVVKEATGQHMQFRDYVDKKYGFSTKRTEIAATKSKEHDDQIRKDAAAERDKYWSERSGNNPMVREGVTSGFSKVKEATSAGKRGDPLKMNAEERRAQTRKQIVAEITENEVARTGVN
jgi:hypothetical protein